MKSEKQTDKCKGCIYHKKAKMPDGDTAHMCSYESRTTAWECYREGEKYEKGLRKL